MNNNRKILHALQLNLLHSGLKFTVNLLMESFHLIREYDQENLERPQCPSRALSSINPNKISQI